MEGAAGGSEAAREAFARLYLPAVRAYLGARWADNVLRRDIEDAVQEVFVDLMEPGGALTRVRRDHGTGGFRAFLYGVARNVARRHEERAGRRGMRERPFDSEVGRRPAEDDSPSRAFDRAWAQSIMRAARRRHALAAAAAGEEALARVELLRLRFQEGLPIRTIAARSNEDPAALHHQYARARQEFAAALYETVAQEHGGTPADVRRECAHLIGFLR